MKRRAVFAAVVLSFCLAAAVAAGPADLPTGFTDELMAGSLSEPVSLALIPDPPGVVPRVLFVEQRTARIRLIVGYDLFTVGTVPGVNSTGNERGLLGIAVDPAWPVKPYVYIHATDNRSG